MALKNKSKKIHREELNQAVSDFLKKGGQIIQLEPEEAWDPQRPVNGRGFRYHYTNGCEVTLKCLHT